MPTPTTTPRTTAAGKPVTSASGWRSLMRTLGRNAPTLLAHNREVRRGFGVLIRRGF